MANKTSLQIIPVCIDHDIQPGESITGLILSSSKSSINDGDIIVISQKVISKQESRIVNLNMVIPSELATGIASEYDKDPRLVQLILNESREVIRYRKGVIVVENNLGLIHANAGIDRSNLESDNENPRVLLLPVDPDKSATEIKMEVLKQTEIKIGVIINDSSGRAWRNGIVGIAIGSSGAKVLSDLRGETDLFGNTLEVTEVGIADEIASAASLLMGQGKEGLPVVLVKGMKESSDMNNAKALIRKASEDLFR